MNTAHAETAEKKALLETKEAASYLGRSEITLRIWRTKGQGPRFVKMGTGRTARVAYRREDIDAWLEKCTVQSTVEVPVAYR